MRKVLIAGVAALSFGAAQAQFTQDYLKAADDYYRKGDYYSAAQYYEKFLARNTKGGSAGYNPYVVQAAVKKGGTSGRTSTREEAVYNTAESYRMLNYYAKAEPFYKEAMNQQQQFPLAAYYHATTLRALERYEEAQAAFTTFLAGYSNNDQYRTAAEREIKNLQFIQQQLKRSDLAMYNLQKAPAGLNDTGANYAPVFMDNNTVLFTSTRPVTGDANKTYLNRIYTASMGGGAVSNVAQVAVPQDNMHQGVAAVTPDGNTFFLTRWTIANKVRSANVFLTRKSNDGSWSAPQSVASLNQEGASTQQPFVMPGGRQILFSSNRTGGLGGFDLYIADLGADGAVSNITNLGPTVNTSFDEQAPYYHAATGTLVFSSNGRVGMGEYDLFWSKGTPGNWSEPVNFGYPVNSVKDDIYFASKGGARNILEDVLLSTDRASACCLELFSLQKKRALKQISGTVLSCDNKTPLAGASVTILDTVNNRTVATLTTDANGRYVFTMEDFQPVKAVATVKEYYTGNVQIGTPADLDAESTTSPELCLVAIKYDEPVVVNNIFYEFAKWNLKEESFPELDKLVKLMSENPSIHAEIGAHTDAIGSDKANQILSEKRAQSVVNYLVSKGISKDRLTVKGYGETMPIEPNKNEDGSDNPAGREKNRRTEFKVIK
ncbi:OmpA family protein [Flaviaesturariibacter flavus]|nr:OmpA family protein [Flaviaesturariibacter flavus]